MTYQKGDPYWTKAKFDSVTKSGQKVRKGDKILYYPNTRTVVIGEEADKAWRDFLAAAQDEEAYNR